MFSTKRNERMYETMECQRYVWDGASRAVIDGTFFTFFSVCSSLMQYKKNFFKRPQRRWWKSFSFFSGLLCIHIFSYTFICDVKVGINVSLVIFFDYFFCVCCVLFCCAFFIFSFHTIYNFLYDFCVCKNIMHVYNPILYVNWESEGCVGASCVVFYDMFFGRDMKKFLEFF